MSDKPLWSPGAERIATANLTAFIRSVEQDTGTTFADYPAFYDWSVRESETFWTALWDFAGVRASARGTTVLVDGDRMPGAKWFPDARLNYAENLLRHADARGDADALVFRGEDRIERRTSWRQLRTEVSRFAQALAAQGVGRGDRVAGYLPNLPEAIVAMLATTSLGAIWSSASPDFGVQGVIDRFGQIEPKVLVCADGYFYNGKQIDSLERIAAIAAGLPTVGGVVVVDYTRSEFDVSRIRAAVRLDTFVAPYRERALDCAQVPFDHPLFVLYSSGTTGVPKCIVHAHGGVLLQHLKEHLLHTDVRPGDRLFYFTTCGWMMWNWLASGLATGATLLLYDGSPTLHRGRVLFDYAEAEGMTHFGTSAKYIDALAKTGLVPRDHWRLASLRAMLSTGSPLAPESFDFVYRDIKADLCLSSISGGTDIVSCFALGNPILPVWRGELQCRGLALAVDVFGDDGRPLRGGKGELVCTKPFPSMPVGFWNDPDGAKYHAAYFGRFPNVWCHGDFCELTAHGGMIIHGRSDAVLNPGGVRIGTAEIYRQVEKQPEVLESLVIGQEWDNDVRVVLFVHLRDGVALDAALIDAIKRRIRDNTTPRHVPAKIVQVSDIPRTRSGKIVELAVRNVVHGRPVKNAESLANPEALEFYRDRPELAS
ncbi:MAG: acetoacetate--CoA ligase [Betaproteobacteria bacterium]